MKSNIDASPTAMISPGGVSGGPRVWLRLEGLAVLALAVFLYQRTGGSWLLFAILFLLPDISFIAYLLGPRFGAACYNALHSYIFPLGLVAICLVIDRSPAIAIIWIAHIGFDRVFGYGLKYDSGFGHTHLGPLGAGRAMTGR